MMKKMFAAVSALFCCGIFPVYLRAQDDTFRNLTLTQPDKNIVYLGVNNQIMIAEMKFLGTDGESDDVSDVNGETFILKPKSTGNFSLTYLDVNDQSQTVYFEVRKVPVPQIRPSGIYPDTCTIQEILDNPRMMIVSDVPDTYLNYEVESYLVVTFNTNGSYTEYRSAGSDLPQSFLQKLPSMPAGTQIFFDEIRIKMPGEEVRMGSSIKILR